MQVPHMLNCIFIDYITVADPGFPVGGTWTSQEGEWTPEAVTFRKFCMSKQKNWDPLGGGARAGRAP